MSATGKRLDLRFGAFACSVQGFDDPVQPVQQILRAIQHLLEESPELSDTAINFDAEAIEQLVGEVARRAELDENEVEIVPGLVIIHHGAGGDLAAAPRLVEADAGTWAAPEEEEETEEAAWAADAEQAEGGYVNLFAPAGNGAAAGAGGAGEEPAGEEFADRLRRMAQASDADYGWGEDEGEDGGGGVWPFEPEEAAKEEAAKEEARNLFATDEAPDAEAEPHAPRSLFALPAEQAEDEWQLAPAAEANGAAGEAEAEAADSYTAASFAERAGASSVPELMVASAAWMVLIQGQTSFKRRDVLDVFETLPGEHEKTLEAQIKGFGKAVRNGQLVAVEDGVFGLARTELARFQRLL